MRNRLRRTDLHVLLVVYVLVSAVGCHTLYYDTMEKLGYHKRDLLVSDVEKARDAQQEAKEQFKSAFERFSSVLNVQGGELQDQYNTLNSEYERCARKAKAVRTRIASVEDVSDALFKEWKAELGQYSNAKFRRTSEQKLNQTRKQYGQLIKAMKRAEVKMNPVMAAFKDQVLFLKHNLNAQAIASLKSELASVEQNISSLIKEMEESIKEADSFLTAMATDKG